MVPPFEASIGNGEPLQVQYMVGSRARQRNKEIFGLHPRQTEGPSKSSILSADCVPGMFLDMNATVFQSDAPLDKRRIVVRRNGSDVEMVELPWGLRARDGRARAVSVVRSEGRRFPTHRCLVPASEFRHKNFSFSLADGDWFYFAGIWRPAAEDWPEGFAILTIEANPDLAPYQDRQMAVLRRDQRMAWLDGRVPEDEILRPLPEGTFRVKDTSRASDQPALAS